MFNILDPVSFILNNSTPLCLQLLFCLSFSTVTQNITVLKCVRCSSLFWTWAATFHISLSAFGRCDWKLLTVLHFFCCCCFSHKHKKVFIFFLFFFLNYSSLLFDCGHGHCRHHHHWPLHICHCHQWVCTRRYKHFSLLEWKIPCTLKITVQFSWPDQSCYEIG